MRHVSAGSPAHSRSPSPADRQGWALTAERRGTTAGGGSGGNASWDPTLAAEAQAVQRLTSRGPMPLESLLGLVDLPQQLGLHSIGEKGRRGRGNNSTGLKAAPPLTTCLGPLPTPPCCSAPTLRIPHAGTLGRFVERRPNIFQLRGFPGSPTVMVSLAPGAEAWLEYKRTLLQASMGCHLQRHAGAPVWLVTHLCRAPGCMPLHVHTPLVTGCPPLAPPQFLADHGRVEMSSLPRPPPDLAPQMLFMVRRWGPGSAQLAGRQEGWRSLHSVARATRVHALAAHACPLLRFAGFFQAPMCCHLPTAAKPLQSLRNLLRTYLKNEVWLGLAHIAAGKLPRIVLSCVGRAQPACAALQAQQPSTRRPATPRLQVWLLLGPKVYSEPQLQTAELRPFALPPGPAGVGARGAPAFPPICPNFHGTIPSCRLEEQCPFSHARVRAWF